jgi:putative transposase
MRSSSIASSESADTCFRAGSSVTRWTTRTYVENNPVKAGMVPRAEDWPWSSAVAHISGRTDGLTEVAALGQHVLNWRAMLADGLEASDRIETAIKTGRPLGNPEWITQIATSLGRSLDHPKMGRPKK